MESFRTSPESPERARLTALLVGARNIANVVYELPYRQAWALKDGRYAVLSSTKYSIGYLVTIYPDYPTYLAAWDRTIATVPDPETGRIR